VIVFIECHRNVITGIFCVETCAKKGFCILQHTSLQLWQWLWNAATRLFFIAQILVQKTCK